MMSPNKIRAVPRSQTAEEPKLVQTALRALGISVAILAVVAAWLTAVVVITAFGFW